MFESPEEVKKAMIDLKIFEAMEKVTMDENEVQEEQTDIFPQVSVFYVNFFISSCFCVQHQHSI